jgi:mannose-6-phosphate isomerase
MPKKMAAATMIIMGTCSFDQPFRLLPIFRERVWGRESLMPYLPEMPQRDRIGEVWFTFEENRTPSGESLGELIGLHPEMLGTAADPAHPGICPLLVKLLFTTERLSVQVHPADDYALRHHGTLGKTEAWYVLDAQPPAEVAVGFREALPPERLREVAQSGEIEQLLDWRPVSAGDMIFVPAGTVHAIGAGLTICEIQENSDITYRLYDYGRPRELHLEHGMKVSHLGRHDCNAGPVALADGRDQLVACEYFRIERLRLKESLRIDGGLPYYLLLICVKGDGKIAGEDFMAGQAWMVPAGSKEFLVTGAGSEWIVTYTAEEASGGLQVT